MGGLDPDGMGTGDPHSSPPPPAAPPGPAPHGYARSDPGAHPRWAPPVYPGPSPAAAQVPWRSAALVDGGLGPAADAPLPAPPPPPPPPGGVGAPGAPGATPATRSAAWRWVLYALGGFLVGQIVGLAFTLAAGAAAGKTSAQMTAITKETVPPEWYIVSSLLGLWVGFIGAPWLATRTHGTRRFLADLGVRFRWVDLWGLAIGPGGQILVAVLYAPFVSHLHNLNGPTKKLTGGAHGGGIVILILAVVILAPVMEELFFRGLLFRALARLCTPMGVRAGRGAGIVLAVAIDGVLFGLAHAEWLQLAGLAAFGMVLAAISWRTGRLGMNMVAHASFNLVAVVAVLAGSSH